VGGGTDVAIGKARDEAEGGVVVATERTDGDGKPRTGIETGGTGGIAKFAIMIAGVVVPDSTSSSSDQAKGSSGYSTNATKGRIPEGIDKAMQPITGTEGREEGSSRVADSQRRTKLSGEVESSGGLGR
jgi:hypothetical protein